MKKQIERCLPSDPADEVNTTAKTDSMAAMMAGHAAALIALIDLLIEKRLASKAEVLTHFMEMFAAHSMSKSPPASAAAIRRIIQVLRMKYARMDNLKFRVDQGTCIITCHANHSSPEY